MSKKKQDLPKTLFGRPIVYTNELPDISGDVIKLSNFEYYSKVPVRIEVVLTVENDIWSIHPKHESERALFNELAKQMISKNNGFSIGYEVNHDKDNANE